MFPDFHRLTREWKTFYGACVIQDKLFHIAKINQQPIRVIPLFQPTFLSKTVRVATKEIHNSYVVSIF